MRADLHMHSIYSDGMCTPEELALKGKQAHLQLMSITDHDNFSGDERKRKAVTSQGMTYLSGIEISAYEGKKKIHITGYGMDLQNPLAQKYQDEFYRNSLLRLDDVLDKLYRYKNIRLQKEDVIKMQREKDIPVHTMHVVMALKSKGFYKSFKEVFADCFMPNLLTYSFVGRCTPKQAIDMLHALGGVACIAHPGRIDLPQDEKEKYICALKEMGVDGIECDYSTHTVEQTEYFKSLAKKLNLLQSGGSDFHSDFGRREVGMPEFYADEAFLSATHVRE